MQRTASIIVEKVPKQYDSTDPDVVLDETDRFQRFDTFNMMEFLKNPDMQQSAEPQIP